MSFLFRILGVLLLAASAATQPVLANALSMGSGPAPGPLRWKGNIVRIAISDSISAQNSSIKADSDVEGAISRSIKAWESAADLKFIISRSNTQSVSPAGNAGDGTSLITIAATPENVALFAKDGDDASARTRIFYNARGNVTEADIVLNPYQQFSTDGTFGTFDLESTLTHEIGHLLGLEHSEILGSTMHANHGRNGLYSLNNYGPRTLAPEDISAIRGLYGERDERSGTLTGKLVDAASGTVVWAENFDTGRIDGEAHVSADGTYKISGLASGRYGVYYRTHAPERTSSGFAGAAELEDGSTVEVSRNGRYRPAGVSLTHVGLNAQLAQFAVTVNAGSVYRVYLAGKGLDPAAVWIGTTSPFLTVDNDSIRSHDYGPNISVVSLEIAVDHRIPPGNFTLFAEAASGERTYLPGALSVESFSNPWSVRYVAGY